MSGSSAAQRPVSNSIAEIIAGRAAQRPDVTAFITADGTVTWAQYDAASSRLARILVGLGLQPGERVAALLSEGPAVHIAYVAAEKAGLVAVAIGRRSGVREVEHALRITGASALISEAEHQGRGTTELVAELRTRGIPVRRHLVLNGETIFLDGHAVPASTADAQNAVPERRLGPDGVFLLNFTSGTTGMPKCVQHNQRRWMSFHEFAVEAAALTAADVFMSVVPAAFGFGLWTSHFTPTILGSPAVLMPRFSAEEAVTLIERHRVTVLAAVSTQFIMMLNAAAFARHDLTSLRVMFTGGEMVPYDRAAEFEERTGARVLQFYGSNETGAVSRTTLRDPREKRLRTAGRIIPAMQVRLFDPDGRDVTASGHGQPGCKGPTLSGGYYGDEAANAKLIRPDGWMLLGDIVDIDAEGYLRVVGRADDFIIRGGKNISAAAVEQEVGTHPAVALAAAVAMPAPVFGERVCVYVELRERASLQLPELLQHLAARKVSKEIWPERLVVVPELPRAPGGKIAKQQLRDDIRRYLAAEGGPARKPGA